MTQKNAVNKILDTTDVETSKVSDLKVFGDGDYWQLICKASSEAEGWMKSTKALEIDGVGCLVQITTQQGNNVAEAVTFVPNTYVEATRDSEGNVIGRKILRYGL